MGDEAIVTWGLTKRYGSTLALDGLDLSVKRGEIYGLLGPNGAGKTTTIRLLLGLIRPTSGAARVMGYDAWRQSVQAHRHLAYVPAELSLWPQLTGGQTLELLFRLRGGDGRAGAGRRYMSELVERFQLDPTKKVRSYSTGNRQKLGLIAAFMSRPEVLVLDEPTAGLDPLMIQVYRDCIREASDRGATVFVSSHVLSEIEAVCTRVGLLRDGKLVDEGPLDAMRHIAARRIRATFSGPPPELSGLDGVGELVRDGNRIECFYTGEIEALVSRLAGTGLVDLICTEPSLEEVFLAHYGEGHPGREFDSAGMNASEWTPESAGADSGPSR